MWNTCQSRLPLLDRPIHWPDCVRHNLRCILHGTLAHAGLSIQESQPDFLSAWPQPIHAPICSHAPFAYAVNKYALLASYTITQPFLTSRRINKSIASRSWDTIIGGRIYSTQNSQNPACAPPVWNDGTGNGIDQPRDIPALEYI